MSISKVEAFKTSDGRLFESDMLARNHEIPIIKKRKLEKLASHDFSTIEAESVVDFIMENEVAIQGILEIEEI